MVGFIATFTVKDALFVMLKTGLVRLAVHHKQSVVKKMTTNHNATADFGDHTQFTDRLCTYMAIEMGWWATATASAVSLS